MKLLEAVNILKDFDVEDPMNYNSIKIAEGIIDEAYEEYYSIFKESSVSKDEFYLNLFMINEDESMDDYQSDSLDTHSQVPDFAKVAQWHKYEKDKKRKKIAKGITTFVGVSAIAGGLYKGNRKLKKGVKK